MEVSAPSPQPSPVEPRPIASPRPPARSIPLWSLALVGWLAARAWSAGQQGPPPTALVPGGVHPYPARALRSWPGVGETRALEIAEAHHRHPPGGPPLLLSDVPGIGERTERAVRAWLTEGDPTRRGGAP